MLESLLNKDAGHQACNLIKKRLLHRCFPCEYHENFISTYLKNLCKNSLLGIHGNSKGMYYNELRLESFSSSKWFLRPYTYFKIINFEILTLFIILYDEDKLQ